uniref:At1g61320/AtMIF1 LRR domain-containing protein n=1 Tax=Manihot esculenta TaxID=3983 RepID=A0A2C9VQ87_MANES
MATAGVQLNKKRKISQLQRAIRTSVLSQRWRNLCKSTSRLDFDDSILVPKTRRVLRLENLYLTSEVVEILLSHCPGLEVLQLTGSRGLVHLKIYGHWLKLKKLETLFCRDLEYIEISRTNLVSFKYFGPNISILLYDVPHLIEASIRGGVVFHFLKNMSEFSAYLSQLETFELDLMSLAIIGTCPKIPKLSNVKHLELAIYAYDAYDHCVIFEHAPKFLNSYYYPYVRLGQ